MGQRPLYVFTFFSAGPTLDVKIRRLLASDWRLKSIPVLKELSGWQPFPFHKQIFTLFCRRGPTELIRTMKRELHFSPQFGV